MPGEIFDKRDYRVSVIRCAREAKPFVEAHHYSGSFPATRLSCGLFRNGAAGRPELVGVCAFSVPVNNASVLRHTGLDDPLAGVDLGRLVLLDDVAGNAESWFVSKAFRELRREKPGVISVVAYSDPVPRLSATGEAVMPGHVGTVYRALSANFRGRSSRRTDILLPSGKAFSPRAASKLRNGDVGAGYAERLLVSEGADPAGGARRRPPGSSGSLTRAPPQGSSSGQSCVYVPSDQGGPDRREPADASRRRT